MLSSRAVLRAARAPASRAIVAAPSSLSRSYATPAAVDAKPPKALYGLDGTYASALVCLIPLFGAVGGDEEDQLVVLRLREMLHDLLATFNGVGRSIVGTSVADFKLLQYTAAVKSSSLDSTAKALSNLSEVYTKDPKLAQILLAPTLSAEDKTSIVNELVKSSGGADKEGTVKNFLTTLADYNRLGLLKGVTEKFAELISAGKGEVELTVTSATVSFVSFCCLWERKRLVQG